MDWIRLYHITSHHTSHITSHHISHHITHLYDQVTRVGINKVAKKTKMKRRGVVGSSSKPESIVSDPIELNQVRLDVL